MKYENIGIAKGELTKLFHFATSQTYFHFDGDVYDQIDGVAMGSPLGPALANLFMGYHESNWLESPEASGIVFYRRYVDDIFCVVQNENESDIFLNFLNSQHSNIEFTVEREKHKKLAFLDVLCHKSEGTLVTSLYRKGLTGLLMNIYSYTCDSYKRGLVKTLIDCVLRINSGWEFFHADLLKLLRILQRNEYPLRMVDSHIKNYLTSKFSITTVNETETDVCIPNYFKLPFIGIYSNFTQKKINKLINRFCKENIRIHLVFSSFKLSSMFSTKDKVPFALQSFVVYKFVCSSCEASYIGETRRHIATRMKEHLVSDKQSHIFKHLQSSAECKSKCDVSCFSILDKANSTWALKIKEALAIGKEKPTLNTQMDSYKLSILV